MRTRALILLTVPFIVLPQSLASQGLAVGVRVGTLGFGGELAYDLNEKVVLRGGLGAFPVDYDGEFDGVEYKVTPPSLMMNLGIDLYPTGGSFRLMAGLLYRDGDFNAETGSLADYEGSLEIGDGVYDQDGSLGGIISSRSTAPFVGVGFGRHTSSGFGVFMDFGLAFVGDPDVTLSASGPIEFVPGIEEDLEKEARAIEEDADAYLRYWPILSIGVRLPFN